MRSYFIDVVIFYVMTIQCYPPGEVCMQLRYKLDKCCLATPIVSYQGMHFSSLKMEGHVLKCWFRLRQRGRVFHVLLRIWLVRIVERDIFSLQIEAGCIPLQRPCGDTLMDRTSHVDTFEIRADRRQIGRSQVIAEERQIGEVRSQACEC